ncbi:ead/Ea22-like family protein [Klebsiella pneumoniae]
MTDITELAQREKFEAWWEREYKHLESSKYTDAVPHIKYGFWMAYQAGGAELVEALEKAQTINAAAEKLVRCKGRYHSEQNYRALAALFGVNTPVLPPLEHENVLYADTAEMEIEALRQRIAELEREQEHLRPVGVMSEQAFHRLENRECRFIALWPRPGIFLPRKRPEDGVIVYARTAAATGIKVEAE